MIKLAKIDKQKTPPLYLRIGIALTLIYAAIAAFITPDNWIGFIPDFISNIIPATTFLFTYSLFELGLGVWVLSGKKTFYASSLSALTMLGIIVFNTGSFDIIFRDISIFLAAVALAIMTYEPKY